MGVGGEEWSGSFISGVRSAELVGCSGYLDPILIFIPIFAFPKAGYKPINLLCNIFDNIPIHSLFKFTRFRLNCHQERT